MYTDARLAKMNSRVHALRAAFSSFEGCCLFNIFEGQQRAIGELMAIKTPDGMDPSSRKQVVTPIGYAEYIRRMRNDPEFATWMTNLLLDVNVAMNLMIDHDVVSQRLIRIHNALVSLIRDMDDKYKDITGSGATKPARVRRSGADGNEELAWPRFNSKAHVGNTDGLTRTPVGLMKIDYEAGTTIGIARHRQVMAQGVPVALSGLLTPTYCLSDGDAVERLAGSSPAVHGGVAGRTYHTAVHYGNKTHDKLPLAATTQSTETVSGTGRAHGEDEQLAGMGQPSRGAGSIPPASPIAQETQRHPVDIALKTSSQRPQQPQLIRFLSLESAALSYGLPENVVCPEGVPRVVTS